MTYEELSSSVANGEDARVWRPGFLSVLLFPPVSALLAGVLVFIGLVNITTQDTGTHFIEENEISDGQANSPGLISAVFTAEVQRWAGDIETWAAAQDLDPNLVATVMQIESCGDPQALSPAGAMGLFQVMPYHFVADENAFDPKINSLRGLGYLSRSLDAFNGDAAMAMAGYNGGINGASRPQHEWASETQGYYYWGSGIYADAQNGSGESSVLNEWLAAGGASLCQQAAETLGQLALR
jgi:soluble lytic murein transglycosylase-like protein